MLIVSADERNPRFGDTLGWDRHVSGEITTLRVQGGHSSMHRERAQEIGAALTEMIDRQIGPERQFGFGDP